MSNQKYTWTDYLNNCIQFEAKGEIIDKTSKNGRIQVGTWILKQMNDFMDLTDEQHQNLCKLRSWAHNVQQNESLIFNIASFIEKTGNITKSTVINGIPIGKILYDYKMAGKSGQFDQLKCWAKWKTSKSGTDDDSKSEKKVSDDSKSEKKVSDEELPKPKTKPRSKKPSSIDTKPQMKKSSSSDEGPISSDESPVAVSKAKPKAKPRKKVTNEETQGSPSKPRGKKLSQAIKELDI
jgi:hypothetical protein